MDCHRRSTATLSYGMGWNMKLTCHHGIQGGGWNIRIMNVFSTHIWALSCAYCEYICVLRLVNWTRPVSAAHVMAATDRDILVIKQVNQ